MAEAIIVMGVAGSGKTTVGLRLAKALSCPFRDGDDFHTAANIARMSRGEPRNDDDRQPWLFRLRDLMEDALRDRTSIVIGCSALRESYRAMLLPRNAALAAQVKFIWLRILPETATQRLHSRPGHFMQASMIESQFAALEEPRDAIVLDAAQPVDDVVTCALQALRTGHS